MNTKAFTEFQNEPNLQSTMMVDLEVGYIDEILYAADSTSHGRQSAYHGTDHVQPTSSIVERFFSMCKRTMSNLRKNIGPESLDGSLILRISKDLWLPYASQLIQEIMLEEAEEATIFGIIDCGFRLLSLLLLLLLSLLLLLLLLQNLPIIIAIYCFTSSLDSIGSY